MDVKSNFIFFQKQNRAQPPRPKYPSASFAVSLFRMHTPARAWYSTLSLTLCISLGLTTFASHFFHPRKTVSSASSVFYFYQTARPHSLLAQRLIYSSAPLRLCASLQNYSHPKLILPTHSYQSYRLSILDF